MALSPGTIVVANPSLEDPGGPRGLFAVDPATGQQTTLAQGDLLVEPWNVSFLADGRLLVADRSAFGGTGGLIVVDPTSGQQIKVSSSPVFTRPFGMVLIGHGQLVVAYTEHAGGLGALAHVNPANGDHQRLAEDFRFDTPFAMALDAAGNIFVTDPSAFIGSDNRLIRIDTSNRLSIRDDTPGIYTGVAVEPTGNLIVTSDAGFTGERTADGPGARRHDPRSVRRRN
jgi:hypothetical protein